MRTKVLLGLAALAASAIGASASNVYSLNVVGYINIPLHEGFQVIASQLDLDGTGINNTVTTTFGTNLPNNSRVYLWNGANWGTLSTYSTKAGGWSPANLGFNPGQAAFLQIPAGAFGGGSGSVTTTGNVLQGSLANQFVLNGGFSAVGSKVPLSGGLQTSLLYTPQFGDRVYQYKTSWSTLSTYSQKAGGWSPSEPQIALSEGFFLNATNGPSAAHWTQNFTVQ